MIIIKTQQSMTISVFTPVHRSDQAAVEYVQAAFESLRRQEAPPHEWVILLNGDGLQIKLPSTMLSTSWVKLLSADHTGNIGRLKQQAAFACAGDVLVELDFDDQLTPDALDEIETAFRRELTVCAYSNSVEKREDGTFNTYGPQYGWKTRENEYGTENIAFPEKAHYMRRIEWAPNHVRAFRASAYRAIGGHNPEIAVGDDHDLICRMYSDHGEDGFCHIDKCLYLYNVHSGNTCNGSNRNAEVQAQVDANYCNHAEAMYKRWAQDEGYYMLDLGGRIATPPGYISVDLLDAGIIADLNEPWPFDDNSVGVLRAYHVLEHLADPIHFFNEAYRVLAPGGFLLIEVPSAEGAGAFGDPTHTKFFNLLSFEYFTNQNFARFIQPQYKGRFQKARVVQYWWDNPKIPVISAQLIALKGWYDERWCGLKEM